MIHGVAIAFVEDSNYGVYARSKGTLASYFQIIIS